MARDSRKPQHPIEYSLWIQTALFYKNRTWVESLSQEWFTLEDILYRAQKKYSTCPAARLYKRRFRTTVVSRRLRDGKHTHAHSDIALTLPHGIISIVGSRRPRTVSISVMEPVCQMLDPYQKILSSGAIVNPCIPAQSSIARPHILCSDSIHVVGQLGYR